MSKPSTTKKIKRSNPGNTELKAPHTSTDKSNLRKTIKPVVKENEPQPNTKTKLSTRIAPVSTPKNETKGSLKGELNKTKPKITSHRSSLILSEKTVQAVNKTATTTKRSDNQSVSIKPKKSTPEMSPSSRVTKTQYFPSKKMYSNAVREQQATNPTNVNNTVSIKPDKSKQSHINDTKLKKGTAIIKTKIKTKSSITEVPQKQNTDTTERPRTATLKRGSIVNSNIAGPDIPISETPSLTSLDLSYEQEIVPKTDKEANHKHEDEANHKHEDEANHKHEDETNQFETYDYEDDFDSYESDFEEYVSSSSLSSSNDTDILSGETTSSDDTTSVDNVPQKVLAATDEERMLDSGNFDMQEIKHKQLLDNIIESKEPEKFEVDVIEGNRSNMGSLSDEGFEEGKLSLQSGNAHFINFGDAQKKWKQNKNLQKQQKRGEEILNMIRLDRYNFTLIDMPPISYSDFIRSFGKINTLQSATQTGDDNTSEEIQTDKIEVAHKWTQFPVKFSEINSTNNNYLEIYKKEYVGVGDDFITESNYDSKQDYSTSKRLKKFLSHAGQTVLTILEESNTDTTQKVHKNTREIPFSSGYIEYDTKDHMILRNRPITYISFCPTTNLKILTVHGRHKTIPENTDDDLFLKSIVCIWCLFNPKAPEQMLTVSADLRVCCFTSETKSFIFGGLYDGSIAVWDISEDNRIELLTDNTNKINPTTSPVYITEINYGHSSSIVSIHPLLTTAENFVQTNFEWKSSNNQICSLDEIGNLIVWGVIRKNNVFVNNLNAHTALPFARVSLVKNSKISLTDLNPNLKDLLCTDMNINIMDPNHIFISTNYGYILHCLTTGTKVNPGKFNPGVILQANCLESCPYSPLYFFAGYDDGTIVLYSRLLEKPLMIMSNKEDTLQSGIQLLQWSCHRPCVFYAKDLCNTIHVWDLAISDLYPIYSIPFKENITCMRISPASIKHNDTSYMVIATDSGNIHLHILNSEHGPISSDRYLQDMNNFLNYVNRL